MAVRVWVAIMYALKGGYSSLLLVIHPHGAYDFGEGKHPPPPQKDT